MPCVDACAANTNDIMCTSHDMDALATQLSLGNYYVLEITYTPAIHASKTTSTKINYFTFSYPKS